MDASAVIICICFLIYTVKCSKILQFYQKNNRKIEKMESYIQKISKYST